MKFSASTSKMVKIGMVLVGMGFLQSAHAFFRMPCSQPVVVERSDPIVNPGTLSGHLHTVMGSSGFNFTEDHDSAFAGKCTSCKAKKDRSNYWIPSLFYQAENGAVHRVNQIGGALIYYLQRTDPAKPNEKVAPFPKGFRMLAGDPFLRSYDDSSLAQRAVSWVCLDYSSSSPETKYIPNKNCPNGLRAQIFFPSCSDGRLDSPDHKSHMAYPSGMDSGSCPPTHPTRLVSIFYEVIWDVNPWKNMWWKPNGAHPFVLSSGDTTGYGQHGDFLNGWDQDALTRALEKCTQNSGRIEDCAGDLELLSDDEMKDCVNPSKVAEETNGWLPSLPGCNPITSGPARAIPMKDGTCGKSIPAMLSADQVGFFKKTVPLWDPVGCAADSLANRLLPTKFTDAAMTIEKCGNMCQTGGYKYAGLQWGVECFCGNTLDESKANLYGSCNQPCAGDPTEFCGNSGILSVYKYNPNKTSAPTPPSSQAPPPPSTTTTPAAQSSSSSSNPVIVPTPPSSSSSSSSSSPSSSSSSSSPSSPSSSSTSTTSTNQAPPPTPVTSNTTTASLPAPTNGNVPAGWRYRGCYVDTVRPRTLSGTGMYYGVPMTPSACTDYCSRKGFVIAGTEYSGECFCGNRMQGGAILKPESECDMPCKGDSSIMCGGPARLSVYTRDMRRLKRDPLTDELDPFEKREDAAPFEKRTDAKLSQVAEHPSKHRRAVHGRSRMGI